MKKKISIGFAVLAIAAVAAWNVNLNAQKSDLSDLALANVEALAQETSWHGNRADYYDYNNKCYQQCVRDGDGCVYVYSFPYNC